MVRIARFAWDHDGNYGDDHGWPSGRSQYSPPPLDTNEEEDDDFGDGLESRLESPSPNFEADTIEEDGEPTTEQWQGGTVAVVEAAPTAVAESAPQTKRHLAGADWLTDWNGVRKPSAT